MTGEDEARRDRSTQPVILNLIARLGHQWFDAPLGENQPNEIDLATVLDRCRNAPVAEWVAERFLPATLGEIHLNDDDVIEPRWSWSGLPTEFGVLTDAADGHVVLDPDDLSLIDLVTGPITVRGILVSRPGEEPSEIRRRLSRLAAAHQFRLSDRPAGNPTPSSTTESSSTHPGESTHAETRTELDGDRRAMRTGSPAAARKLFQSVRSARILHSTRRMKQAPTSTPEASVPVPVYSLWFPHIGPLLSLGSLTANARRWNDAQPTPPFEIRRVESPASFLEDLATRNGRAILLCSDYVWSLDENLDVARRAVAINPELVVIHGGPSAPKYDADAARFLDVHRDVAHILVRGEGESTLVELLSVLGANLPDLPWNDLSTVEGLAYRHPEHGFMRTNDRVRIADLDTLVSPYLSGEYDHLAPESWAQGASVESNRGCPYGCTFCDWGSATMSRIRKFDLDRVRAELDWLIDRGVHAIQITDANFGIMARDVEIAAHISSSRQAHGRDLVVMFTPAKNTTKHLTRIMDVLSEGGVRVNASLSLQTTDPATLDVLDRSNITLSSYVALAAEFRRRHHPLQGDLMVGLPGQTIASFKDDLQFMIDHEVTVRSWPVLLLPNSPMNEPSYRRRHELVTDDRELVISSSTFSADDRDRMFRLRNMEIVCERWGVLRHVLRYLQWDHDHRAIDVIERIMDVIEDDPHRYPMVTWLFSYFDLLPGPPLGWTGFYEEVGALLEDEFDLSRTSSFECVLGLQEFLMPRPGREFPSTVTLAHDYVQYYRSAAESLLLDGRALAPVIRLEDFEPCEFTVTGDPLGLCTEGLRWSGDSRDLVMQGDFQIGAGVANEMESPLMRILPVMAGRFKNPFVTEALAAGRVEPPTLDPSGTANGDHSVPVRVTLGSSQ